MRLLDYIKQQLDNHLIEIETALNADILTCYGPIIPGLEGVVKKALESFSESDKKSKIGIILDTPGGVIEVTERIVDIIRHHYSEVIFIIPDKAMSAGTIFALPGDKIIMNYSSCLGPIDPQVYKDDRLIPALSYLYQFERLNEKAAQGNLTSAEYALLSKMDLGELYQYEQIKELTMELAVNWLTNYKFRNWDKTEARGKHVTPKMKKTRAKQIAKELSDSSKWHSHGRGINMETLRKEMKLKIEDISTIEDLGKSVTEYYDLLKDFLDREKMSNFIHTKKFF